MCTRGCPNANEEICAMCGGVNNEWLKKIVKLDADTKGELRVKLEEIIKDKNEEVKKIIRKFPWYTIQRMKEVRGLLTDIETMTHLLIRVDYDEATNADLELIDVL